MQFKVLLLLVGTYFACTEAAKSRSINVAIDTLFEFDHASDEELISQVQGVLDKVKKLIRNNKNQNENVYRKSVTRYKFSDFLEDILVILLAINDDDLKEIVYMIDKEIKKGPSNNTLEGNIRRFLHIELDRIKLKPIDKIRQNLNELLRRLQNAKRDKDNHFLNFINSMYMRNSEEKLMKFIRKLKVFRRTGGGVNMQNTVRKAVRFILLEKISNLSKDKKRKAKLVKNYNIHDKFREIPSRVHKNLIKDFVASKETESAVTKFDSIETTIKSHRFDLAMDNNDQSELTQESIEMFTDTATDSKYHIKPKAFHRLKSNGSVMGINKRTDKELKKSKRTHITLYPEQVDVAKNNIRSLFKTSPSIPFGKVKRKNIERNRFDDVERISHSAAEIDVHFKNKNIKFTPRVRKDGYLKAKRKNKPNFMKSKRFNNNGSKSYDLYSMKTRRKTFTMHNTEGPYFGSKHDKFQTSPESIFTKPLLNNYKNMHRRMHKVKDYLDQIKNKDDEIDRDVIETFGTKPEIIGEDKGTRSKGDNKDFRYKERLERELISLKNKHDKSLGTETEAYDKLSNKVDKGENKFVRALKRFKALVGNDNSSSGEHKRSKELNTSQEVINSNISTSNINKTVKLNTDNIKKYSDYLESTTKTIPKYTYKPRATYTKAEIGTLKGPHKVKDSSKLDKVTTDRKIDTKSYIKTTIKNIVQNKSTYSKVFPLYSITKAENATLIDKITENDDANKIIDPRDTKYTWTTIHDDATAHNKIIRSRKSFIRNQSKQDILTLNINEKSELNKQHTIKYMREKQTRQSILKPKITANLNESKSHTTDTKPIETKTIDSRRLLSPKTTEMSNTVIFVTESGILSEMITEKNTTTVDVQKLMKEIHVKDVEDTDKKKAIEQQMKADLENLFTEPSTNATTSASYTDIFDAVENVFDMGLK